MSPGWNMLSPQQQEAAKAAARLIEDADLQFMMMLFRHDQVGALVANIEPADAVRLIESALKAAKDIVEVEEIASGRLN